MSPIEIAIKFASLGYYVFPLYRGRNNVKLKPYGWAKNQVIDPDKVDKVIPATCDEKAVAKWPEEVRVKYKSEVIGFGVVGIECLILDLDVKGDKTGFEEFSTMVEKYGVPKTPMATVTKSGGLHLYYQKPKKYFKYPLKTLSGVQIGKDKYPSIDLRGDGGFVVGPEKLVKDLSDVEKGVYGMKGLTLPNLLPEFPDNIVLEWLRPQADIDVDNIASVFKEEQDFKALIRRGIMPELVPKGARNESFFIFISVLKSRGVPIDVARQMCAELAKRVEEPETLGASVDLEAMLAKAYVVQKDNPYDVAVDLIDRGLFQVTGYKSSIHYVILEDNPYIASKSLHDEMSMKTLLTKYQKQYVNDKGKSATLNPIQVIPKVIGDENRVDMLGFKPNAGEVFSLHDEPGSKKFLNTFRALTISHELTDLDESIWEEFDLLMTRLFGDKDSDDYKLGMDFIAWLVQTPEVKPSIAPFIMSTNRGVGKSLLFNVIIQIMGTNKCGESQARITKLDELAGRFFDPSGCIVNLIDEVQFSIHKDTRKESTAFWRHLKNIITAETVSVEIKGGATYQRPNAAAVMMAGNFGAYFPIEEFDRRLWIIDNNPPLLEMGTVDKLFNLVRRISLGPDDRQRYVSTLRYHLKARRITMDLASMRAPMTNVKQEMYENSLTDLEEWFVVHFKDPNNVFAYTPIVSQSAMYYVYEQSGRAALGDNSSTFFRDLKRKGYIRPIRVSKATSASRQFTVPVIGLDGTVYKNTMREVLYTTRRHGDFDSIDSQKVMTLFTQNCASIQRHKLRMADQRVKVSEEELLGR